MTPDPKPSAATTTTGTAKQLFILLHGVGSAPAAMAGIARALAAAFPRAAIVVPEGFDRFDLGPTGRQWFSVKDVDEINRIERIDAVMPKLLALIRHEQQAHSVGPEATALVGFSQGAILALEAVSRHDGLAGRVLAFAGRYAKLPEVAPANTTLHLLHGEDDAVIPLIHARAALEHLERLQGDASLDVARGVGHEPHPALVECAIERLRGQLPMRTWRAALAGR